MTDRMRAAALGSLIILQGIMLLSLFFKLPPHPPETIPLGGMGPMIAAGICAAAAALILRGEGVGGKLLILLACLIALLSYGPQKYLDPAFPLVWPAVVAAQVAVCVLLLPLGRALLGGRQA